MRHPTRNARVIRALLALVGMLPLIACKDTFPVPLDPEPKVKLDPRLVGVWACVSSEPRSSKDTKPRNSKTEPFSVVEFQTADLQYLIRTVGLDRGGEGEKFWDSYPSLLGVKTILNTWPKSDGPRKKGSKVVFFAQKWLSKDRFDLDLVTTDPLKGLPVSPAAALRKTLESRIADQSVFKPWMACTRAKAVKS